MKTNRKNKIDLLLGLCTGNKTPDSLVHKTLANIYTEDVDEPGTFKTITGQPITKVQMDKECRHFHQIIVQLKTRGLLPIANSEDEIQLD